MTNPILNKMEECKLLKNNSTRYDIIQCKIRREIKTARAQWMVMKCKEIEDLIAKHVILNMHRLITEVAGINKRHVPVTILDDRNRPILNESEIKNVWETHVSKLFEDDGTRRSKI